MLDNGLPIRWKCRDCDAKLDAPNPEAARLPAAFHYIKTGHTQYEPRDEPPPSGRQEPRAH
jgi:hypothetical protein